MKVLTRHGTAWTRVTALLGARLAGAAALAIAGPADAATVPRDSSGGLAVSSSCRPVPLRADRPGDRRRVRRRPGRVPNRDWQRYRAQRQRRRGNRGPLTIAACQAGGVSRMSRHP
jgi:hypothetical protein